VPVLAGAIAIALLITLAALLYNRADQGLRDKALNQVRDDTALAAQLVGEQTLRFSETVQDRAAQLSAIATGPVAKLTPKQKTFVQLQLRALVMGTRGLRGAGLATPEGVLLANYPPRPQFLGRSFAYRDWFHGVTQVRSPYVSRVFNAASAGHPKTVTVAALVKSAQTGRTIGVLSVGLERRTQELAGAINKTRGLGIVVTDQGGDVVALSGVSSNRIQSMGSDPLVQAALAGKSGTSETDDAIAGYAPVPGIGWTVSARLPTDVALADVHDLRTLAIILTAVIAVLMTALAAGLVWFQHRTQQLEVAAALREQAVHLHDDVVQKLTIAQAAREAGDHETADRAVADALHATKEITAELLPPTITPGDLVGPDVPSH
jgi:C4-dicarboxylate-specific signal transduction histidine kinase